ncbi:MAG: hypothetical protein QOG88_404, partial [Actinomycetota bacterium]|nr:hypothetical protein [Actinomycetota bacterium]
MNLATIAELMAAAAGPAAVAAGRAATQSVIAPVTRTLTVSTAEPAARQGNGKRARAGRAKAIDAEVPQLLDLLAVASSAGLSAPLALRRAAEAVYGPLADELSQVLRA